MNAWKRFRRWIRRTLWRLYVRILRVAMVGDVKGRLLVHPADFDHPVFGKSRALPTVLEIVVDDDEARPPADVGRLVKRALFPDEGRFRFNVAFSCGDPGLFGKGRYTDPRSIWFNVFFGYYELDAPVRLWRRPLGYRAASPGAEVEFADVVRIGKADWNYFSNHVYGVPLDVVRRHDAFDPAAIRCEHLGREKIGESWWDHVVVDGVEVVSAYTAAGEKGRLERTAGGWTSLWRFLFGRPCPRPDATVSFVPTRMRAELYMAFRRAKDPDDERGEVWRTLIFGGTARSDFPDPAQARAFLDVQLATLRGVMAHAYPQDGFPTGSPS
jgi:hypothetical protein